jgi:hypothetical protein
MPRADLDSRFKRIDQLAAEIYQFVPAAQVGITQFRADLAGLLVVLISASYEACVKDTLVTFATKHHSAFGVFTINNYKKLNSKITIDDLYRYAATFDQDIHDRFKNLVTQRKMKINRRVGKNIESCYKQILSWRHDFAHAGLRNTTVEEALATHRLSKRILYSLYKNSNHLTVAARG